MFLRSARGDTDMMSLFKGDNGARIYRPGFRQNKSKTLVFSHRKRAFWACFRENRVYKFGHGRLLENSAFLWIPLALPILWKLFEVYQRHLVQLRQVRKQLGTVHDLGAAVLLACAVLGKGAMNGTCLHLGIDFFYNRKRSYEYTALLGNAPRELLGSIKKLYFLFVF